MFPNRPTVNYCYYFLNITCGLAFHIVIAIVILLLLYIYLPKLLIHPSLCSFFALFISSVLPVDVARKQYHYLFIMKWYLQEQGREMQIVLNS